MSRKIEQDSGGAAAIKVGPLRFSAYRKLREALFGAIDGPVRTLLSRLFESLPADSELKDIGNLVVTNPKLAAELGTAFVRDAQSFLSDFEANIVKGCVPPDVTDEQLDAMDAVEYLELRQSAVEKSDFIRLIELEKNSLTAAVKAVIGMVSGKATGTTN